MRRIAALCSPLAKGLRSRVPQLGTEYGVLLVGAAAASTALLRPCVMPIQLEDIQAESSSSQSSKRPCRSAAHAPPDPEIEPASEEDVEERLACSPVVLFMKGSPDRPRCGFSRVAVETLKAHGIEFAHVDVLEEPAMRQAMKKRWPTFPQLWVEGVLLGGSDAVKDLATRCELIDAVRSSTVRESASLRLLLPKFSGALELGEVTSVTSH